MTTSLSARAIAEPNTILRTLVGSTVHGLHLEGSNDRDEMGVCVEPPEVMLGLYHFEQWVDRTQPEGVRSGPGDLDLTVYSLRKWAWLAATGNPTVLLLLFTPDDALVQCHELGRHLRKHAYLFATRAAAPRFLGYLRGQRERLLGVRGQMRVTRTELIECYGYNTKYAMQALRLGYQGLQFLQTGRLTLPMPNPPREHLRAVHQGQVPFVEVIAELERLEIQLQAAAEHSPLPSAPNYGAISALLVSIYRAWWFEQEQPRLQLPLEELYDDAYAQHLAMEEGTPTPPNN